MTKEELDKFKQERSDFAKKIEADYHRGDAEDLMQMDMFISIFEQSMNTTTQEEDDQILLNHGWTLTKKDGTVLNPDGTKGVASQPSLSCIFAKEMHKLKGCLGAGSVGGPYTDNEENHYLEFRVWFHPEGEHEKVPEYFQGVPVICEIKITPLSNANNY